MEAQSKQRVFTGVVTQLQDNYGMVDQEVHFQTSDVIGRIPQLGEKVLVKAVWDPSVSVSWTAQRVQSLNSQPFKSPPPLLPTMTPSQKPGILGSKPQPLLKSPKIPPLIPSMQQNPPKPGLLQTPSHLQAPWGAQFDAWGNRKRHGEGMGGRRGGRWEDGGSWGGDAVHQKRRRWRGSFEEGEKKSSPTPPQNCPLFSRFPRDSSACDSLEVQRRYPHLPLPENFLHLQLSWTESFPPDQPLNLSGPCPFHLGPAQSPPETSAAASPGSAYSAKVMLLSVPAAEELYQRCCGLTQDQQEPQGGAVHPTTLIKFLLALKGSELQLLGGRWCPLEDGSNPAKDPLVLIRTAVRCVKEQTGLDLSHCSHWYKMAEVRYLCGGEVETAVFYLPDVWRTLPTEEEWAELRASAKEEQEDGALPLPEDPSLVVYPCPGTSLSSLALSYLLEPRNSQSQDAFEVALSAELFSEMLQRDFGLQIYRSLCGLSHDPAPHCPPRPETEEREESTPTGAEGKKGERDSRGPGQKDGKRRSRRERGSTGDPKEEEKDDKHREEGDGNSAENKDGESETASEEGKMQAVASDNSDGTSARESDRPAGWSPVLPRRVLLSWVFFDRQLVGSLRGQDLQDILLSLGLHLTPMQARELVCRAVVGEQCQYRRLAGRWEDPEHTEPDSTLQGNSALIPSNAPKGGGSSRRSGGGGSVDVVTHKGSVLNIPNLLRSLERGDSQRQGLEQRIAALQARLAEAESETESLQSKYQELSAVREGQEDLRERLERAERLNSTYEKSLKENAGHMIAVIEKMQKLVDKTTSLAESRVDGAERA
ncbi:cell cycle and apoptosis regulator protein 2 [Anguilla anguilla]|uniref:cell cycle and apoptosis regulator protein 2 n=1 Tax=Anguilla anguilla TaxID=7936 RepID=UPI0015A9C985|nr:cell cycle and apoptosis regulator protein 2 [Anguilla anguilla]XP_035247663.1 cell cycle and apoptosis regulator protein 2 [Anguilla anguilla]XP_035247664.1 cell cycle and apoptosis regulator protein 2 [Anguilla anguilla]